MFRVINLFRNHRRMVLFLCDMLLWNLSYYLSFAMRKNNFSLVGEQGAFLAGLLTLNIAFVTVFLLLRLYDKLWRYADTEDFFYAAIASLTANIAFMTGMLLVGSIQPAWVINSKVFITNALMSTLFVMLFRIIYRLNKILERRNLARKAKKRLMIIGAGEGALSVLSELSKTPGNEYIPVCIVDDNREKLHRRMAGVRVEAQLSLLVEGEITAQEYGEIQFTEYGLSGIPVFQMSGRAVRELLAEHQVLLSLDLNPEHTEEEVFLDLVERKLRREKRESGTLLLGLVPSKMVPVLFKLCDIPLHIPCEEIAKDKLLTLAHQLKYLDFEIIDARDFDACQVTSGGIPATEVSLALESIKVRGLYFAGEILDLDGPCGGYNLQWAWSSAHAAGLAAAKED